MSITYKTVSIAEVGRGQYQVRYTGTQSGIKGMSGEWTTEGVLADVHSVTGYLVAMNAFTGKPIAVMESMSALFNWVESATGLRP